MPTHRCILKGLDSANASSLHAELLSRQGEPLIVDASQVMTAGTLGFQVLVAAAKTWESDKCEFSIVQASPTFLEALNVLGIEPSQLNIQIGPQ